MNTFNVVGKEQEGQEEAENGDIYDSEGNCIGNIEAFKDLGSIMDAEISVFHEGYLYNFKFDYRTKAETENKNAG